MPDPKFKEMRQTYGFDEVALVPGDITINPDQIDTTFTLGDIKFPAPVLASAMDSVVDPSFAIQFGKMGGLAVLNLEGLQFRYDSPEEIIEEIAKAPASDVTSLMQKFYS
ncbi:MAG: IMP dehydrogenase, partial [Chloroflexota bacterium]|nr:IMP dehydrogenase [Chloroflexota bacterium]